MLCTCSRSFIRSQVLSFNSFSQKQLSVTQRDHHHHRLSSGQLVSCKRRNRMNNRRKIEKLWREADAVCFDVDSTVIKEEGIDELAKFVGKGAEVEAITIQTMSGGVTFREALSRRLGIIRPSKQQMEEFSVKHGFTLTVGIRSLIGALHDRGCHVYLISGGFQQLVEPVAKELGVPADRVFTNELLFNNKGEYNGFSLDRPVSQSGGKSEVIARLIKEHNYQRVVMIGDGATDMEASPPAHGFIGFGGNSVRKKVEEKAEWFVKDFKDLLQVLNVADNHQ